MNIVALITDGFGRKGGIALYNRLLLSCLCNMPQTSEVKAFSLLAPEESFEPVSKLNYLSASKSGKLAYCLLMIQNLKSFKNCSALICGHINLLPPSALIARFYSIPLILISHGAEVWQRPSNWKGDWMWAAIDRVICVSNFTRKKLLAWSELAAEQVSVIHNAIDLSPYKPGPKPDYLLDRYNLRGKKVILTVGRLDANERAKGFDQIINLLPKLLGNRPNLAYLIVGTGKDLPRLQNKAKQLGVVDNVVFAGWIEEEEKLDHYRLADAYVMPSRLEGFGYVFLEAMASGLPVVGSKIDGGRDALLNGELGELVDPNDTDELFSAIEFALKKEKYVPEKLDGFSIQRFNREISQTVLELITGRSKSGETVPH